MNKISNGMVVKAFWHFQVMALSCLAYLVLNFITQALIFGFKLMNGFIGGKRLKKPYVYIWRVFTWGTLMILVLKKMDGVVDFLNYVIWGH